MVPRSEYTKRRLVESLLKLMSKGKGFDNISIQDIVEEGGFSRMAYYRNFKSKADILRYHFDTITTDFIEETNTDLYEMPFDQYLTSVLTYLFSNRELALTLLDAHLFIYVREQFDAKLIKSAKTEEEAQRFIFFAGGLFNIFYHWLLGEGKETPEQIAKIISSYIERP
ncbi:MAG: TetR/AcrR family transcriptional regulator [Bacilli bacterium]